VTDVKVVDASALAALVFGEPEAGAVAERLTGARLTAPALLGFEIANICVVKMRRHRERSHPRRLFDRRAMREPRLTVEWGSRRICARAASAAAPSRSVGRLLPVGTVMDDAAGRGLSA